MWHPQQVSTVCHATPAGAQGAGTQGECLPNPEQPIILKEMPTLPHVPSLASYHLKCHTSSPSALHSALYLRMGTPPVASGSSNCTCAVLEYGSTWSMDGEDGVSVGGGGAQMETQVSPVRSRTELSVTKHVSHFCSFMGILSPISCPPAQLTIGLFPTTTVLTTLSLYGLPAS